VDFARKHFSGYGVSQDLGDWSELPTVRHNRHVVCLCCGGIAPTDGLSADAESATLT